MSKEAQSPNGQTGGVLVIESFGNSSVIRISEFGFLLRLRLILD
jgi:hypothetical protein